MVFVTNQDAKPGTVSVIDGNSCNGGHPSGCAHQPFTTVDVGGGPSGLGVNPLTDTIYVANTAEDSNNTPAAHGNTLSVIDGATCTPTNTAGCASVGTVKVGAEPANVAIDPATNSVYVANTYDNTSNPTGTVSVVSGAHCDASDAVRLRVTTPPQVPVGADPVGTTSTDDRRGLCDQRQGRRRLRHRRGTLQRGGLSGCRPRPPTITGRERTDLGDRRH